MVKCTAGFSNTFFVLPVNVFYFIPYPGTLLYVNFTNRPLGAGGWVLGVVVGFVDLGVGLGVELGVELGVRGGVVFGSVPVSCPGLGLLPWPPTLEQLDPSPLHTPHLSKRALESTEPSHPIVYRKQRR